MKVTALRSISKINRNVLRNSCRNFSFKFEMTPASRVAEPSEETKPPAPEEAPKAAPNFRYNVCQPRTSSVERPSGVGDVMAAQRQTARAAIEEQHLQPSMLPEYYQKQMEKNVLINPEPELTEGERINKGRNTNNQRRFQVSKTYANAILPLKSVKLANPFPEPVKMMMSRTVSDDEKAEQMLAESRSQMNHSGFPRSSSGFRTFATEVKRWYSSKSGTSKEEKCKKLGTKGAKKGCPKMKMAHCPPVARTTCDRIPKHIICKKQEAPYPAYSEFCHEDIDEKPSECKLCPWKPEDNPNFKPQKKKMHTFNYPLMLKRSGLETEWIKYKMDEQQNSPILEMEEEEEIEGMQCDLRKPPCDRPKNRRCPPTKEEKKKEEEKKKKKIIKKDCISDQELDRAVLPERAQSFMTLKEHKDKKDPAQGICKIRKFKFPPCNVKIQRDDVVEHGKCPKKKKGPKIRDCPPSDDKTCNPVEEIVEEYLVSGGGHGDKERKCPKVDMTVQKDEEDQERCPRKKKDHSKNCPTDLLHKKRRGPRKKTSGVMTPTESRTEQPRPRKTI